MGCFQLLQFGEQTVVLGVGYGRRILDVIGMQMAVQLCAQSGYARLEIYFSHASS